MKTAELTTRRQAPDYGSIEAMAAAITGCRAAYVPDGHGTRVAFAGVIESVSPDGKWVGLRGDDGRYDECQLRLCELVSF